MLAQVNWDLIESERAALKTVHVGEPAAAFKSIGNSIQENIQDSELLILRVAFFTVFKFEAHRHAAAAFERLSSTWNEFLQALLRRPKCGDFIDILLDCTLRIAEAAVMP